MDLVSFDTPGEYKMFEEIMKRGETSNYFIFKPSFTTTLRCSS